MVPYRSRAVGITTALPDEPRAPRVNRGSGRTPSPETRSARVVSRRAPGRPPRPGCGFSPQVFPRFFLRRATHLGAILLLAALFSGAARAQEFGQNRIQFEKFDFSILHTPHFDVYFYPAEGEAARYAATLAERWYTRHCALFADSLRGVQPLILYASFPQFEATNVVQGIGQGTGGVTEPALRRIVLPFAGPLDETSHVIGHELVHAFQYDLTGRGRSGSRSSPGVEKLPLWFIEGMAEYFSLGPVDANTAMWMRDATRRKLPRISDLSGSKFFPYRFGQALLAYIGGRWGDDKVVELLRRSSEMGDMTRGIDSVLTIKPDSLSKAWHRALHAQYDSLRKRTQLPADYGKVLIAARKGRGELNVSPVLSPDGKKLVFFSTRDYFSIDLFLADAETGKVEHNILRSALDSHLEGLEFISSAGSFSPDGKRFVFSGVHKERPVLEILDLKSDGVVREIPFPDLGEILSPAWSPDGRFIAFSAIADGFSDLFLYDLDKSEVSRITHDPYADLQPVWSPDSRTLVFSSDRFTTSLPDLGFGHYGLVSLDLESRRLRPLPDCRQADNINPQFSADGRTLFWISNRGGIANIYREELADSAITQVTNLFTGVSGITSLSPAISVAARSDRLVYSTFEEGRYSIWEVDPRMTAPGTPPAADTLNAAALPPVERKTETLVKNLHNPHLGLASTPSAFAATPYRPSFKLVGAGQGMIGAGNGPYGAYAGGGVTLFWTDMLGNRNLETALSVQTGQGISDISGLLGYSNTGHRVYWGAGLDQVPYIYTATTGETGFVKHTPVVIEKDYVIRQTDRELSGSISYPFNTATRLDLGAGFRNIAFSQEVRTIAGDSLGNVVLDSTGTTHPASLNLGLGSLDLVYDNSVMGGTGPVLGRRWRIGVSPTVGSLAWTSLEADYRDYFIPVRPVTVAWRLMHYGRYGRAAENSVLSPLSLGYPGLIRGYGQGILGGGSNATTDATVYTDPLYGSRLLLGSAEVRFPLFGLLGLGEGYYGIFPVDVATFVDTGVAWWQEQGKGSRAWFLGGNRRLLTSAGEAFRMNLFGYAVAEIDYSRRFTAVDAEGITPSWSWQLNLIEGF